MGDDDETKRILAVLVRAPDNYMSAPRLGSTTMKLRRMTEEGLVVMSLSKKGLPFYQITPAGSELVLSDW